jgi:hypothetical protein
MRVHTTTKLVTCRAEAPDVELEFALVPEHVSLVWLVYHWHACWNSVLKADWSSVLQDVIHTPADVMKAM